MGLGVLDDKHLEHVPGTALLTDMLEARQHRYHGEATISPIAFGRALTVS